MVVKGVERHRISVTRLGDLLDFGQLFKAFGNNYLVCLNLPHS